MVIAHTVLFSMFLHMYEVHLCDITLRSTRFPCVNSHSQIALNHFDNEALKTNSLASILLYLIAGAKHAELHIEKLKVQHDLHTEYPNGLCLI